MAAGSQTPQYDHGAIERRQQAAWRENAVFRAPLAADGDPGTFASPRGAAGTDDAAARAGDPDGRPRWIYIKASAPFTSGNIHMGHVRSYAIGDAYARFARARGDNVLIAFGYDAFGLPAELGAIAADISPAEWVRRCAERMTAQLDRLGFSFDWERTFMSSDPVMYRWSQWLFLTLLEAGLVYRGTGTVDWCPTCNTTLATIQVENGTCWRCHGPVALVERPQWLLRISAYVEENDRRAGELGHWDETALGSQREVLGRVDGVELELPCVERPDLTLTVFTPHADQVAGARFAALSPRHPELARWTADADVARALEDMRSGGWERSEREAEAVAVLDTGLRVRAPDGSGELPVLVSPLVDSRFGPTAILGVPSHDRTDEVIARRVGIEEPSADAAAEGAAGAGGAGPAGDPDGRAGGAGGTPALPAVRYRARDFSISRQRYWGTPIPIVYCPDCGIVPLSIDELPLELPLDIRPTGAENPLASHSAFHQTACPRCGGPAKRETDTLDCHFDALWLWVPACVPAGERERPVAEILALEDLRAWLPSERLVAGSDSGNFMFDQRITTKALRDIGPLAFLSAGEPFAGALMHEMVIRDGRKMSKHLGNVVEPDALVEQLGADTVRLAVLYAARPQRSLNWSESAVAHCHKFLRALWSYAHDRLAIDPAALASGEGELPRLRTDHLQRRLAGWCETAVERITAAMLELEMHRAVRDVMRLLERIGDFEKRARAKRGELSREDHEAIMAALEVLLRMLNPFAPHVAQELLGLLHGAPSPSGAGEAVATGAADGAPSAARAWRLGDEAGEQLAWPAVAEKVPA
ncbi:MAG: class I tRNA ligase family protein [Acidobacteriota bacterium]|nr:class I tRNA ligase family protein [Acidobacteriota bacterium]